MGESSSAVAAAAPVGTVEGAVDRRSTGSAVAPALVAIQHIARNSASGDGIHTSDVVSGVGAVGCVEGRRAEGCLKGALGLSGEGKTGVEARSAAAILWARGIGRAVGARVVVEVAHVVRLLSHCAQ